MNEEMIASLEDLGALSLGHRPVDSLNGADPWFAKVDSVEVGNGAILTTIYGNGQTPYGAIEDLYRRVTHLKEDEFLVVHRFQTRLHMRWTGHGFRVVAVGAS